MCRTALSVTAQEYFMTYYRRTEAIKLFQFLLSPYRLTGYRLDGRGLIPGKVKNFSLLQVVQTGSGAHPAYHRRTGGSFPTVKVIKA
jgi:hypothetical protein